jgi:hypothetical protein
LTSTEFNQIADEGEKATKTIKIGFPETDTEDVLLFVPSPLSSCRSRTSFNWKNPRGYAYRKGKSIDSQNTQQLNKGILQIGFYDRNLHNQNLF